MSWHTPNDSGYERVTTNLLHTSVLYNTFITVHISGYYQVYGQLTYHNQVPEEAYGFEILRITCHETTDTRYALLSSMTTQTEPFYPG